MERRVVRSRQEFIEHVAAILEHIKENEPENATLPRYLEAAADWLEDADGFYANVGEVRDVDQPDWQLFADVLSAALVYE